MNKDGEGWKRLARITNNEFQFNCCIRKLGKGMF